MSMLIERARQWGEDFNQEWLEKGRREGRMERKGSRSWSSDSSLGDSVARPRRTSFPCSRASRIWIA